MVPVLSVAFGISSASIATYLYLGMKRIRTTQAPDISVKKRVSSRKIQKRPPQPSSSLHKVSDLPPSIPAKLKPIAVAQSHAQTTKPPLKEREDHASNPETRKQS
ncbi:hypothetical protein E6H30_07550 [Candidatus Bathyarchaeota archaeon]|nr:MAG: hypothetical protein E6H30_07550 [Candidatus Bathyarchaeota archaeon]